MKTTVIKKNDTKNNWKLIDADGIRLGRLATKAASMLIGKHKVKNADYLNNGDVVVIVNAQKVSVHPSKLSKKMYYTHSGYIGGLKSKNLEEMLEKDARRVIEIAVKGMLPKNKLGASMLKNLFVYNGSEHPHIAQQPEKVDLIKQ